MFEEGCHQFIFANTTGGDELDDAHCRDNDLFFLLLIRASLLGVGLALLALHFCSLFLSLCFLLHSGRSRLMQMSGQSLTGGALASAPILFFMHILTFHIAGVLRDGTPA